MFPAHSLLTRERPKLLNAGMPNRLIPNPNPDSKPVWHFGRSPRSTFMLIAFGSTVPSGKLFDKFDVLIRARSVSSTMQYRMCDLLTKSSTYQFDVAVVPRNKISVFISTPERVLSIPISLSASVCLHVCMSVCPLAYFFFLFLFSLFFRFLAVR